MLDFDLKRLQVVAMTSKPPKSRRMSSADRREKIVESAAFVFAESGFSGAKTQVIARRAGVSEALLYQHFKSKGELFKAVLRKLLRRQDNEMNRARPVQDTARDTVASLREYLSREIAKADDPEAAIGNRLLAASLAGDGVYAKLLYRRALRHRLPDDKPSFHKRDGGAATEQDLQIEPGNALMFVAHLGMMLSFPAIYLGDSPRHQRRKEKVLHDALLFCVRGLGMDEALVRDVEVGIEP